MMIYEWTILILSFDINNGYNYLFISRIYNLLGADKFSLIRVSLQFIHDAKWEFKFVLTQNPRVNPREQNTAKQFIGSKLLSPEKKNNRLYHTN